MGWVLGWAIPEDWFTSLVRAEFPEAEHVIVTASPHAIAQLESAGPFDWVVGYSLGSLLLLGQAERVSRLGRVALLAPILGFTQEKNLGGRVTLAQLRQLKRWLRRDAVSALSDFYQRAGLALPTPEAPSELRLTELVWGLEQLEQQAMAVFPVGWRAWCGGSDPLLDVTRLREIAPEIAKVSGVGHHPAGLLQAFRSEAVSPPPAATNRAT